MAVVIRRGTLLLLALALSSPKVCAAEAAAETSIDLTPRVGANDFAEVTIELECGGTMQVRDDNGPATEPQTLPMSVSAKLVYDEHRVAPAAGTLATRSIRYYNEAAAVIKVDNGGLTPKLADDRRLVVADNPGGRLSFAAADGLLQREELDLIDVTGDSLAVDGLLPEPPSRRRRHLARRPEHDGRHPLDGLGRRRRGAERPRQIQPRLRAGPHRRRGGRHRRRLGHRDGNPRRLPLRSQAAARHTLQSGRQGEALDRRRHARPRRRRQAAR